MSVQVNIEQALMSALMPTFLQVDNESHLHSSGKGGDSHFNITVVSSSFMGQSLVARHRAIQGQLKTITQSVHALGLHTYTPDEWTARGCDVPESPSCAGTGR